MLVLALELVERGHEVLLGAPPDFQQWVESHGVCFRPVGANLETALKDRYGKTGPFAVPRFIAGLISAQFASLDTIEGPFDIVVGGGAQCAAPSLAERGGVPYVYLASSPVLLQSCAHAPPFFAPQRLPRFLNRVLWTLYCGCGNLALRRVVNTCRRAWSLPPLRDSYRYIFERDRVFVVADSHLAPLPPDFGPHVESAGFLFLNRDETLPADLESFLESGPPPVYLGFGSVPIDNADRLCELIGAVAARTGLRLLVSPGSNVLDAAALPSSCLIVGPVSHARLFPRLAAVVHHGGAGTTAAAARAGVPQVVVAHSADQFYWGERTFRCGIGPEPLRFKRLTATVLADRLLSAVSDTSVRAAARDLAARMTNGGPELAARIEAIASGDRPAAE